MVETVYSRPEAELLLRCASPPGDGRHAERIRALSGQTLDWKYLLHLAATHSLMPLLYWGLKAASPEAIPDSLERNFQQNTWNSVHLTGELLKLVTLFGAEGIRVLPVKGPTLAMAAHGNLALRSFSDLDILIPQEDVLRARNILLQNGYRSTLELSARWESAYLRTYDEFGLRGPQGSPLVELHWGITPRYFSVPLDIGPFWSRAVSVKVAGREVPTLCPDDLFLVLCLHASKHCWSQLSMVSDVAWLLAAGDIHWQEIMERARGLGSTRMVLLGAKLAESLFQSPLPETVVKRMKADRTVQSLTAEVITRMFQIPADDGGSSILKAGLFHMRARERWGDRARYFARLTTTVGVEDWEFADLPSWLTFLYPFLRIPRLGRKYWMRIP